MRKSYPTIPKRQQLRQVLYGPLMARNSKLRAVVHTRNSRTSRSSLRLAKAIAKQKVAQLQIRQLQEQRLLEEKEFELKQQRERNARVLEHQREVLKASHQL